jgi:hypothetical protein
MKNNIISHQITTDVVTCFNVQFVIINQVSISSEKGRVNMVQVARIARLPDL